MIIVLPSELDKVFIVQCINGGYYKVRKGISLSASKRQKFFNLFIYPEMTSSGYEVQQARIN